MGSCTLAERRDNKELLIEHSMLQADRLSCAFFGGREIYEVPQEWSQNSLVSTQQCDRKQPALKIRIISLEIWEIYNIKKYH